MNWGLRTVLASLVVTVSVVGLAAPSHSASQKVWNACKGSTNAKAIIRACTQIINGRESRKNKGAAYTNRGGAYTVLAVDHARAIADFNKAIKLFPNFNAYYNRGYIFTLQGKYDQAISDLTKSIKLNPNLSLAYTYRALAYSKKGLSKRAMTDANKALKLDAGNANAYRVRGYAHALENDYIRALKDISIALKLDPNSDGGFNDRAHVYNKLGQPRKALKDASEAIRLNPKNGAAHGKRSRALLALGMLEPARSDLTRALELNPDLADDKDYTAFARELEAAENAAKQAALAEKVETPEPRQPLVATPLGKRVALVIGNANYTSVPSLANPRRDAAAVAQAFRDLGFVDVTQVNDLSKSNFERVLLEFADKADGADWAVVYYAGHGMEMDGRNYLIPVDAALKRDRHVKLQTVSLDDIMEAAGGAKKFKLVILDACRDNPFVTKMARTTATRSIGRGLARIEPSGGVLVAYAARAGQIALDGSGDNSPYVAALLEHMREPGLDVSLMFRKVRDTVMRLTRNGQQPFTYGSLPGEALSFKPAR